MTAELQAKQNVEDEWRQRLRQSMNDVQSLSVAFSTLEPQLIRASQLVTDEFCRTKAKEDEIGQRFRHKLDEYAKAKKRLEELRKAHDEHAESSKDLTDDLECVSSQLDRAKKEMNGKSSSMTDATPLVEIRAAIQRLRKENVSLDTRIGVLDYELTAAKMSSRNANVEEQTDGSDDEHSFGNES